MVDTWSTGKIVKHDVSEQILPIASSSFVAGLQVTSHRGQGEGHDARHA